jgi:hypothetical protein
MFNRESGEYLFLAFADDEIKPGSGRYRRTEFPVKVLWGKAIRYKKTPEPASIADPVFLRTGNRLTISAERNIRNVRTERVICLKREHWRIG